MTLRVYQTTVITSDGAAALEMVSIPRSTMPASSVAPLEMMLDTQLRRWEPIVQVDRDYDYRALSDDIVDLLHDVFGSTMAPAHVDELVNAMAETALIPVEQSDPVLETLAGLGGVGAAGAGLLYGVSVMGPIAVVALPAGLFLWYAAKPAGEGVGGWIKHKLVGGAES